MAPAQGRHDATMKSISHSTGNCPLWESSGSNGKQLSKNVHNFGIALAWIVDKLEQVCRSQEK